tara:strand:+ start:957 stop:1160 length:204 start_codon:yes stop_codon:yes gene_type:complete
MYKTYYNIKTRNYEDYAMDREELAEIIALHTKDKAIFCVETFTEETEDDEIEDYWDNPSLSAAERNR